MDLRFLSSIHSLLWEEENTHCRTYRQMLKLTCILCISNFLTDLITDYKEGLHVASTLYKKFKESNSAMLQKIRLKHNCKIFLKYSSVQRHLPSAFHCRQFGRTSKLPSLCWWLLWEYLLPNKEIMKWYRQDKIG